MKKFCAAAISVFALTACSAKDSPPTATINADVLPHACGASGEVHVSCLPKLPPLTDAQKKTVFAALGAESLNDLVVSTYLFGGPANEQPGEADLLQILSNAKCGRETSQDQEGHSLGRVSGDTCPIAAQSSFGNTSTPTGSREEKSLEIQVRGDDYAARSQLTKYSHSETSDSTVTETSPKRYHVEMSGTVSEGFEGRAGKMTSAGSLGGSGDVDASNQNEIKITSLDVFTDSMMRFDGFNALLHVALKMKEDGTGTLEATLNGEPIALPAGVRSALRGRIESATIRQAISGI